MRRTRNDTSGMQASTYPDCVRQAQRVAADLWFLPFLFCVVMLTLFSTALQAQDLSLPLHIKFTPEELAKLNAKYPDGQALLRFVEGRNGQPAVQFVPEFGEETKFKSSVIQIPHRAEMEFTTGASFDFWVRIDKGQGSDGLLRFQTDRPWIAVLLGKSSDRLGMDLMAGGSTSHVLQSFGGSSFDMNMGFAGCMRDDQRASVKVGQWFRLTWVFDAGRGIFAYVNQQSYLKCFASRPNFKIMNTQDLYFGANGGRYAPLTGSLQDVMIYRRALSEQEVKALP